MSMKVEFINPFIEAAMEVLHTEVGSEVERGGLALHKSAYTSQEVTTLIGVTGKVHGVVLYGMSEKTAKEIVGGMMGQPFAEFDDLAQSGIAELGNVITGRASILLSENGYPSNIAPPILLVGAGTMISTLDIQRLVVPLRMACGTIEVQVALKEGYTAPR